MCGRGVNWRGVGSVKIRIKFSGSKKSEQE